MQIDVVVEIPKGTRNKYEADDDGTMWLDRTLFTATHYPEDYGHVHGTLAEDGDPIDALVLLGEPTFPGCHIHARPVAVFMMSDEAGTDEKLLCVPDGDPRYAGITDLADVSPFTLDQIAHFFTVYKALEPNKHVEPGDWAGRSEAEARYDASVRRYRDKER
jgi:inorganic pyrophosphatase